MINGKNRSNSIRETLLLKIQDGYFGRGEALPAERSLAEEFGVSYMTARKAVSDLVDAQYLVRRGRKGTFVREDLSPEQANRSVGIITAPLSAADLTTFVTCASEIASRNNWLPKLMYALDYQDRVLEFAINNCDAVICFSLGFLSEFPEKTLELIRKRAIPFVLVGAPANVIGIDSVCCPDPQAMNLALDHLQAAGHEQVALAIQDTGDHAGPAFVEKAYWMHRMNLADDMRLLNELTLEFTSPRFGDPQQRLYELLMVRARQWQGRPPFTAVIVPMSFAWGALAAFHDLGLRIPEDISLVVTGDRQEMRFYRPQLDTVRLSLRGHAEEAWKLIDFRLSEQALFAPINRFVEPELLIGHSVMNLKTNVNATCVLQ